MRRKSSLLILVCVFLTGCSARQEKLAVVKSEEVTSSEAVVSVQEEVKAVEPVQEEPEVLEPEIIYEHEKEPNYWTLDRQKEKYDEYLEAGNLDEALRFRDFVESLAQYHHNEPVYDYNPVFLCYEKYLDVIPLILEVKPDLFLRGNIEMGDYSQSPFLFAVKNGSLEDVQFFFENDIPVLDVNSDLLYGSRNVGGPRFAFGGNVLLYANSEEIRDYLISKGVPAEAAPNSGDYQFKKDCGFVYEEPGYDSPIIARLPDDAHITALSVLAYKVDDTQWMKFAYEGGEGWVPTLFVMYFSGM